LEQVVSQVILQINKKAAVSLEKKKSKIPFLRKETTASTAPAVAGRPLGWCF
jgi:hypothetical protein